eukprot:scaffold18126_cov140-Skeletonema_marinoi.AAC.5
MATATVSILNLKQMAMAAWFRYNVHSQSPLITYQQFGQSIHSATVNSIGLRSSCAVGGTDHNHKFLRISDVPETDLPIGVTIVSVLSYSCILPRCSPRFIESDRGRKK